MARTKRDIEYHGIFKNKSLEKQQKQQKSVAKQLVKDGVGIKNRHVNYNVPESYDDDCLSALKELTWSWKNGVEITKVDDTYNIFFNKQFIANVDKHQLHMFPWTVYLPIKKPISLSEFNL